MRISRSVAPGSSAPKGRGRWSARGLARPLDPGLRPGAGAPAPGVQASAPVTSTTSRSPRGWRGSASSSAPGGCCRRWRSPWARPVRGPPDRGARHRPRRVGGATERGHHADAVGGPSRARAGRAGPPAGAPCSPPRPPRSGDAMSSSGSGCAGSSPARAGWHLAHAHQHRGAGVERHDRRCVPGPRGPRAPVHSGYACPRGSARRVRPRGDQGRDQPPESGEDS